MLTLGCGIPPKGSGGVWMAFTWLMATCTTCIVMVWEWKCLYDKWLLQLIPATMAMVMP